MPEIDPVILKLKVELDDYKRELTQATRLTEQSLGSMERRSTLMGERIGKGFSLAKTAAVGFVASLGVDAITGLISRSLEYASSLGEVAQQLGVTSGALQEYRYAGSQAGLSTEEVDQALSQLTRRIGEAANGTKEQAEAFKVLGISIRDAKGNVIATGEAIPQIAEAISQIEDPARRAAIEMDLFGRAGQKLEPLLAGGAAGVNNLRNAAHELGLVLSEDQIAKADDTADKLSALKQVLEARIAGVVADNAGAILQLAEAFVEVANQAGKAVLAIQRFRIENAIKERDQTISMSKSLIGRFLVSEASVRQARIEKVGLQRQLGELGGGASRPAIRAPAGGIDINRQLGLKSGNFTGGTLGLSPTALDRALSGPAGTATDRLGAISAGDVIAATATAKAMSVELQRLTADLAAATADLTGNIRDRANAEKQRIDADLAADVDRISASKDADAAEQIAKRQAIAATEKLAVEKQAAADLAEQQRRRDEDANDIAQARFESEQDSLRLQLDLATTQAERRDIAFRILAAEDEYLKSKLEAVIASQTATDAEKERARIALEAVNATSGARQAGVDRRYQSALGRYADNAKDTETRVAEAAAQRIADLNDTIANAMTDALGIKDPFLSQLVKIFLDKNIFGPLAEALDSQGGGGGIIGALGSVLGSIFGGGRASGGRVNPGSLYRVNEGATPGRVEGFMPDVGGQIIPLGRMNVAPSANAGGGTSVVRLELSGDLDARIQSVSGPVAVEVVRLSQPGLTQAAVSETFRQAGRPRI